MLNNFILMQMPSDKYFGNQIYVAAGNDIEAIKNLLSCGAKEVGRLQTTLTREQFIAGMNAQISEINAKYAIAITGIKDSLKKAGML